MRFGDLHHRYRFWEQMKLDPHYAPHGGESPRAVTDRIIGAMRRIAENHPAARVAMVSHGGALSMALGELIDGVYWGLYNIVERPDASFGENYFGANKDEWDGVNSGSATNEGSTASWNTLNGIVDGIPLASEEEDKTAIYMEAQGLNPDGTNDPTKADYIDIDNYIDYLLVNWYSGNNDWKLAMAVSVAAA